MGLPPRSIRQGQQYNQRKDAEKEAKHSEEDLVIALALGNVGASNSAQNGDGEDKYNENNFDPGHCWRSVSRAQTSPASSLLRTAQESA
jgi:hypothetical protein